MFGKSYTTFITVRHLFDYSLLVVDVVSVELSALCLVVPSKSVSCPFNDAYWLAYNNNSGGFCAQPASYVSPCASNTHLHFRLQKCSHAAYTYQRGTVNLKRLYSWSHFCLFYWVTSMYTVFHKKLYPLLFCYIFSFTKTNFMKIPLSTQEVLVIMSIK